MYEQYQLENGANVCFVPLTGSESFTILVIYPVGSRYESEKLNGTSHYLEHLFFKGTKKRKNTLILTREIDRLGAEYNAFTGKEYTGYYIKTDARYTETAFDILSDMLFESKFDVKEMEREKTVIVEEIRMYNDNPLINIENIFEKVLYDGCPLGRDIAGTEGHVLAFERVDVLGFKERHYQPKNMTIVLAGNITKQTKDFVEQYFGQEKNKEEVSKIFRPYKFGSAEKKNRINIQHKATDQSQLMLGFPGLPYGHKDEVTVSVMNTILGASMSSRLFIQIRERRGLAYMIRSGTEKFRDTGYVYVRAGLEAKNINKAIAVIKDEINKIINKGVTKRELQDAKTNIHGSLTLSLEDSSVQADWYAKQSLFSKEIKTPEQKLKEVGKVTNDQIMATAKRIFQMNKMRVAVIGGVEKNQLEF